jgi:hypothetical protein
MIKDPGQGYKFYMCLTKEDFQVAHFDGIEFHPVYKSK